MKLCKTQTIPFRFAEHLGGYMPRVVLQCPLPQMKELLAQASSLGQNGAFKDMLEMDY
ncbi:hypothetical protein SLEP1_g44777 [Rubroshorea leprosula]|uniref:Uncharacterized protein n=1 Tax=Rubroshorea leprosula TaxID=152421 RepID=A0AAV5LIL4_9ROSI|nr:hypothetical protein SLEP1_g44777 [Rubroshorea leprosula]